MSHEDDQSKFYISNKVENPSGKHLISIGFFCFAGPQQPSAYIRELRQICLHKPQSFIELHICTKAYINPKVE